MFNRNSMIECKLIAELCSSLPREIHELVRRSRSDFECHGSCGSVVHKHLPNRFIHTAYMRMYMYKCTYIPQQNATENIARCTHIHFENKTQTQSTVSNGSLIVCNTLILISLLMH